MAEVLPPLMQSSSTITMLHSRPSSADAFQSPPQQYPQSPRLGQTPRSMYNGQNSGYRTTSAAPVQPYAFQSTPHLRQENRTTSAPNGVHRQPAHAASASTSSSDTSTIPSVKDDSVMGSRPGSVINLSSQLPDLSLTNFDQPAKASPDRYRRPAQRRTDSSSGSIKSPVGSAAPSGNGLGNVSHLYQLQQQPMQRQESVDDMAMPKTKDSELAKRYRRRSLNTLETQNLTAPQVSGGAQRPSSSGHGPSATSTPTTIRPVSFQSQASSDEGRLSRNASRESLHQTEQSHSVRQQENVKPAAHKAANVPPRGSSDANKRLAPSPLSRSAVESGQPSSPPKTKTYAAAAQSAVTQPTQPSAAAAQLAAVSDKDLNKGMKSRLRRAFSFGSAQELNRTATGNSQQAAQKTVLQKSAQQVREEHQQKVDNELELDEEQQEIARRQEAAGIGAGIYSGQGGFSGSTDNLSISSTASSASMMLRKMGRGAKKSARSIKGLFRPKSVIGVPAADGPINVGSGPAVQPSVAQVSMVTVEAERNKVNVNAHPAENVGGGTGFPKLERNSIDAANATAVLPDARGSADGSDSLSRRSIVGSDKDRAEVLAAVKKGILKRSGTGSPNGSPVIRPNEGGANVPHLDSPASSMPSTPKDGQMKNLNGDYFSPRIASLTKSMPNTPNGTARGISFSPRIQFHDAWSSTDYDRRGEIATCNRLTPMLAQQIKEELNTFKMEMEVHELSKPHTHFF